MNRRQRFLCRCTASMEHAADTAEAAAVDRYFSSSTENIFVPVCLYGHRDDCFVTCPRSSVGGAIQMTLDSVTVTVILFRPEGRTSLHRSMNIISAGLMPTEARGNYLPETKTYHSQPLESIRHAGNYFVPLSMRPIFSFCCRSYVKLLENYGLKKISLLPEAP